MRHENDASSQVMPTVLLMAVLMAAPGELFRCPTADGHLHVQGQPCQDAREQPFEMDSVASDPGALSEWLNNLQSDSGRQASRQTGRSGNRPQRGLSVRPNTLSDTLLLSRLGPLPRTDQNLASCSIQFYHCAAQPGDLMDVCVSRIPRCTERSAQACCQSVYIDRFATLRASRWSRQSATRTALLGE